MDFPLQGECSFRTQSENMLQLGAQEPTTYWFQRLEPILVLKYCSGETICKGKQTKHPP